MRSQRETWRALVPGIGAILVVCAPVAWVASRSDSSFADGPIAGTRLLAFAATMLAFTLVFTVLTVRPPASHKANALISAQSALALLANFLIPMALPGVALTGILLAVAAASFARWTRGLAGACIATQTVLLFAIYKGAHAWPLGIAAAAAIGYGLMQMILESTWRLALLEGARRVELEGTLRELRSTQAMLAETARADQRTELARDLHDMVGHQLVALGLQLDAAIAALPAKERERVAQSRELVRSTLASVRSVVAGLRDHDAVDLATALRNLATDGPGPRVVVHIDATAPCMTLDLAETLLRCTQEALTNARKHAGARQVEIALGADRLVVRDDGRGLEGAQDGFGLQSMRARCAARDCTFALDSSPRGTTIEIRWVAEVVR